MADVLFKRGLSTKLFDGSVMYTEGTFYLTTDTHRLYVGAKDTATDTIKAVDLNQYITIVQNLTELAALHASKGDFAYVSEENILAVCTSPASGVGTGAAASWQQINPDTDTNTDTVVTGLQSSVTYDNDNGSANIKLTIKLKSTTIDGSATESSVENTFSLSGEELLGIVDLSVGLEVSDGTTDDNTVELKTTGTGADKNTFAKIKGAGAVNVTASGDTITIDAPTETVTSLAANNNTLVYTAEDGSTDTIALYNDPKDSVTITAAKGADTENDKITVAHKDYVSTNIPVAPEDSLIAGNTFTAITGIETEKGHISKYTTTTYTLPTDENTTYSLSLGDTGPTVLLKDGDGGLVSTVELKDRIYFQTKDGNVSNGGFLDFYTTSEIDNKLHAIDAVHYKGTIGISAGNPLKTNVLPQTGVSNGDMYKVVEDGDYTIGASKTQTATIGDLFIAVGAEAEVEGIIPDNKVEWTYVPSGDDADSQYTLEVVGEALVLNSNIDPDNPSRVLISGDGIIIPTLVESGTDEDGNVHNAAIELNHNTWTINSPTNDTTANDTKPVHGGSFTVVSAIERESHGHITGYSTKTITLPNDNNTTYDLLVNTTNKSIYLKNSDGGDEEEVLFEAGTDLTVNAETGKIIYGHATHNTTTSKGTATTLNPSGKFTVLTGLTTGTNGHITNYQTTEFTLPTDNNTTYNLSQTVSDSTSNGTTTASVKTTLTGTDGGNSDATLGISSSSLVLASNGNNITINLTWGEF